MPPLSRNPQIFVDVYNARDSDFRRATHRIYRSLKHPSHVRVRIMAPPAVGH